MASTEYDEQLFTPDEVLEASLGPHPGEWPETFAQRKLQEIHAHLISSTTKWQNELPVMMRKLMLEESQTAISQQVRPPLEVRSHQ
jgi:hypothetical protein